jgi:hypothetical protein
MMKRILAAIGVSTFTLGMMASASGAAPLPEGCTKDQGTVTCTTFEGPGTNQAGVGETTETETQGNTTNTSPEPQELEDSTSCNPSTSNGRPCNP